MLFRLIARLIKMLYWLGIFISPVIVFCAIGLWLYFLQHDILAAVCGITGFGIGIFAAEYMRRRYGLINFWSGMQASKEADTIADNND